MIWFTADTHFNHANIIKYCHRPWHNKWEMNNTIIVNWNKIVKSDDLVYHLGDFALASPQYIINIRAQLNGRIILINGNHDRPNKLHRLNLFEKITPYEEISIGKQLIVMSHYPFYSWNKMRHRSAMLHGHCHGNAPKIKGRIDVGTDCWDYTPINIDKIMDIYDEVRISNQSFKEE